MFGSRDKEILTELTAIRLGFQYLLDTMFEEAPLLYREARAIHDGQPSGASAKYSNLSKSLPFTPADIIVTDHAKTWEAEMRKLLGDDTELMRAFAKEHGLQAYEAVKSGNTLAVDLFREFSTPSADSNNDDDGLGV